MKKFSRLVLSFCLIGCLLLTGCALKRLSFKANRLEERGQFSQAALLQEQIASRRHGAASAKAWYRAGNLWIEPNNSKKSLKRALTCFYRVKQTEADRKIANSTRLWISILTQLVSANEMTAALKDAAAGSERLRSPISEIPKETTHSPQ